MIGYLRQNTSAATPVIERRPWMRAWATSMPSPRFDAAVELLKQEHLATPEKVEGKGGLWLKVEPAVRSLS